MILTGALVNFITVVAGTLVGLVAGKFLNERIRAATMSAVALITIGIAVPGLLNSTKPLVPILSLVIGTVIGEALDIDRAVNRLGDKLQERFKGKGKITEGFVTGTLVFAVGAMTIMGSLDSGLKNDHTVLIAKSVIDGISSIIFASTMGVGVAFAGVSVFVIEGGISLLASLVAPLLTEVVINEITFVGSLLILGISFNLLGLTKIKLLNMMPAMFLPLLFCQFM
ncbi:MAG: DUF554 domain-containing protein [Oscillospiraceae bacterium]|nr:DUF554 domain-containing protein [Oscillospiraceae bacterium]